MKRFLGVVLLTVAVVLGGCGAIDRELSNLNDRYGYEEYSESSKLYEGAFPDGTEKKLFIPILITEETEKNLDIKKGAERAAKEAGIALKYYVSDSAEEQGEVLKGIIPSLPEAICISAYDSKYVDPYLHKAIASGTTIFDLGGNLKDFDVVKGEVDYESVGRLAAEKFAELLEGEGTVAIVTGISAERNIQKIIDGFSEQLEAVGAGITAVQLNPKSSEDILTQCIDFFEENTEVEIALVLNEYVLDIVLRAAEELEIEEDVKFVGYGQSQAVEDKLKSGEIAAAFVPDYEKYGYDIVKDLLSSQKKTTAIGYKWKE